MRIFTKTLGLILTGFIGLTAKADDIVVDGIFNDWTNVPVLRTNSSFGMTPAGGVQNIEFLKTTVSDTHIYFYLEGNAGFTLADDETFYLLFNTDKNSGTGYTTGAYGSSGIDVAYIGNRIEGDIYKFTGGTNNTAWSWAKQEGTSFSSTVKFSSVVDLGNGRNGFEFSVVRRIFGNEQENVGFSFYPAADWKAMPQAWGGLSLVEIATPPVIEAVVIDGDFADWQSILVNRTNSNFGNTPEAGVQNIELIKTFVTNTHVYFYLEGNSGFTLAEDEQFNLFFNTDKNASTGLISSAYSSSGFDVAYFGNKNVGDFYTYNNSGGNWSIMPSTSYASTVKFSNIKDLGNGRKAIEFSVNRIVLGERQNDIGFSFYPAADWKAMPQAWNGEVLVNIETPDFTLPVSLTSFKGIQRGSEVELNWVTASEKNNSHFELFKSIDGVIFNKIATISGKVNSNNQSQYYSVDRNPSQGANYYKLRQVDLDGKYEEFNPIIINVRLNNNKKDLQVFLKSGSGEITIYSEKAVSSQYQLTDMSGKRIFAGKLNLNKGHQSIGLPFSITSGIYVIAVSAEGNTIAEKIVVK